MRLNNNYYQGLIFLLGVFLVTRIKLSNQRIRNQSLYSLPSNLPFWAFEYIEWHQSMRPTLNETNYRNYRYYVVRCFEKNKVCGGASDRLSPLPVVIYWAHVSRRILLIEWDYPTGLQEYLVPSAIDWTAPLWLLEKLNAKDPATLPVALPKIKPQEQRVKSNDIVSILYHNLRWRDNHYIERNIGGPDEMRSYYRALWDSVYRPSPKLQYRLTKEQKRLGAKKGEYNAFHFRSQYREDASTTMTDIVYKRLQELANHSKLPIYVTGDSKLVLQELSDVRTSFQVPIWFRERALEDDPLHLDRGDKYLTHRGNESSDSSTYMDTFVDLYMLADAKCVWYGVGGFGWLGSLLSTDITCSRDYTL